MTHYEFCFRILRVADYDGDIFWHYNHVLDIIQFEVNCNDLFYWATSETEEIEPCDIDLLETTIREVYKLTNSKSYGLSLFACRKRKMRPQLPVYRAMSEILKPLFDACGPKRND